MRDMSVDTASADALPLFHLGPISIDGDSMPCRTGSRKWILIRTIQLHGVTNMKCVQRKSIAVGIAVAVLGSSCAYAASPAVIAAITARKANYKEIGGAFKTINDEIKTGAPDLATIRPLARDLLSRASGQLKFFPKGSGPESGEKTRAKAAIWADQATFVKLHNDMLGAARALQAATVSGDVAAMTSARTALGGACKACHDKFRESE